MESGFIPGFGGGEVLDPPGKGAALEGAGLIGGAGVVFEENAVIRPFAVEQGIGAMDVAGIGLEEGGGGQGEVLA